MVSVERGQLTSHKPPRSDSTERTEYSQPPSGTKLLRPNARLDLHPCESRKQIPASEYMIEIPPTIRINRPTRGEAVDDRDIVNAGKRREAFERFFPKLSVCFAELWPDGQ